MIEKMKVVHIVAAALEKTALLDKLRELGVVHFAEKASADQAVSGALCPAVPHGDDAAGISQGQAGDDGAVR